jgi:hypothetical protein
MDQQQHYVGLDVSLKTTSICVIDDKGTAVWRGKCASTPESITEAVHSYSPAAVRVGLETGVNAGEKMHRRAGVRMHHRWWGTANALVQAGPR